ncbi:MAG: tripartite tricarboxylate transporter substrate binding protein [Reyranella sp.]|jgi:tripartite-type tricarboxylate transporter receptor subunit TctC|nr:MAG: tripartite tricarboxylate transporter substrate binding protein [Reyranella sp.]
MKRRDVLAGLAAVPLTAKVTAAQEAYPSRVVKILVPFGPGGSTDIISRLVGKQLETATGKPFVVENKPGATGMIGTAQVKNAPADGYTLLLGSTSTLAANPSLYKQMTYDPSDFTTVGVNGSIGNFMLVKPDAPYKTVKEFVAYAKAQPKPLFSGYGNASSRVPAALFEVTTGVKFEEVAYRDAVASIQDLNAGRVDVVFPDQVVGESYVRSGFVRALAVTSRERAPLFPDVEAVAETYPDYAIISYSCFSVRKETPDDIKKKLNRLVMDAIYEPSVMERVRQLGFIPPPRDWDIAKCDAFVTREREDWTRYIKLAKIEPQ